MICASTKLPKLANSNHLYHCNNDLPPQTRFINNFLVGLSYFQNLNSRSFPLPLHSAIFLHNPKIQHLRLQLLFHIYYVWYRHVNVAWPAALGIRITNQRFPAKYILGPGWYFVQHSPVYFKYRWWLGHIQGVHPCCVNNLILFPQRPSTNNAPLASL